MNPGVESTHLSPMDYVEATISNYPVVIFSKTYCPYCRNAKTAISEAGAKVDGFAGAHVIELNTHRDGAAVQKALAEKTGRRTVPNVFIGGQSVGGGDETERYLYEGVLPQMLRAAPQQLAAAVAARRPETSAPVPVAHIEVVDTAEQANASTGSPNSVNGDTNRITFGAGCFWGLELAFQRQPGVLKTEVGYSNGSFTPVDYRAICSGTTGHAEVVRVWYNPQQVSLKDLFALWEGRHDPTSKDKQGNDRGTQYRSAIYYISDEQRDAALAWKKEASARLKNPIISEIAPETGYSPAEEYHQRYLEHRGQSAAKGASQKIRCYG